MTSNEIISILSISGFIAFLYFKKQNNLLKKKTNYSLRNPIFPYFHKEIESTKINEHLLKSNEQIFKKSNLKKKSIISNKYDLYEEKLNSQTSPSTSEYNRAYNELVNFGCKPIHDGDKLAIRVSKSLDGRWFYCKKSGLNSKKDRVYLTLNRMPYLQTLLLKIELNDPLLKIQGGRVLISYDGHYRKNLISNHISTFQVN